MIIGLGLGDDNDISFIEEDIAFDTKLLFDEINQVLYHPALKKISDQGATKLIIPGDIDGYDYDYETLIKHIRTDSNQAIARIPILVYFKDLEKKIPDGFKEELYKAIAVRISLSPEKEEFIDELDEKALDTFKKTCFKEPYSHGSHDKTNLWGSLTLLKSLLRINPDNKDLLKGVPELEDNLSEWTYFKKLIKEFDSTNVDKGFIDRIRSESSKLTKISNNKTVLIIEDQLNDGWQVAYDLFFRLSSNFEVVLFAKNEKKAHDIINETNNDKAKNIDLVLLDIRLDKDRDTYSQDESGHHVENLSGVELAKWIRGEMPTIPIIAATASNKSWTLEALLEQGINGYWVKGSPTLVTNAEVGIENTLALIKKIYDTLQWAQETGHWQNELYRIADVCNQTYLEGKVNPIHHRQIRVKAKSLQALLMRSFSPFSQELSDGLQLNLAFINIYSCMNDLVEWACEIKEVESDIWEWSTLDYSNKYVNIVRVEKGLWFLPNYSEPFKVQPDKGMAIDVIVAKFNWKYEVEEFIRLTDKRNALPLIHGKRLPSGSGSELKFENAKISDIDSLISLLGSLVDRHKDLLDKYGE